jgi:hypothetical protein
VKFGMNSDLIEGCNLGSGREVWGSDRHSLSEV